MAESISKDNCDKTPCSLTPLDILKNHIKRQLRKYFEFDDKGNRNKEYDPNFSAQDFIEDIHDFVGDI